MDGDRACEEKELLVFAVDQRPFGAQTKTSGRVNRFCVLHPLMTLAGERVTADAESFPNTGRVWWWLREDIPEKFAVPGALWTGTLEFAPKWDPTDPESFRFQAQVRTIQPGGRDLVEILPVPDDDPDATLVQRPEPLPWPRPTPSRVFLKGHRTVLGPLKADWDPDRQLLHLAATDAANPEMLRIPVEVFPRIARVEVFTGNLNELDNFSTVVPFKIELSKLSWLNLEEFRREALVVDASTDAQILNWAARHQGLPRAQLVSLREVLGGLSNGGVPLPEAAAERKRVRLRELAADASRVLALDEDVATLLATTPAFADLITKHAEVVTARRVEKEIIQRRAQIEAATQTQVRALEHIKAEIDHLGAVYERRAAAAEEDFRQKTAARLQALENREKAVAARENRLAAQEKNILQRLERVMDRYQREADRVGDELLTQLPILRKLGLTGVVSAAPLAEPEPTPLVPPTFLEDSKVRSGSLPLEEADFIAQLGHVVEHKGFAFSTEDLLNFHVCVKTGGLTILAGISGTGKSSLPRLYAEALGCREEYLHIPVRPDWLDDRDLIGAFNAVAGRYEPANSGLVDCLIAAALDRQRNRGGIYLVCLDEMNLARVEHYFAQFLSLLELPSEDRWLELFAPGLVRPTDPYLSFQGLALGDNLRFLGTVNIDETTHFFSPKVLDRSQVVVFRAPDLAAARRIPRGGIAPGVKPVSLATYQEWRRKAPPESPVRDALLHINSLLARSRLGLGFRQFDRILDYVESARPFFTEDQALDFQLMQVVLPRLRPTAPAFGETLQALRGAIPVERFPRTADYLARIEARPEDDFFQLL
jgi:hypothetical protein